MKTRVLIAPLPVFLVPSLAAQDPSPAAAPPVAPAPPAVVDDGFSGNLGLDFTTQIFLRGVLSENQGVITQPHFEIDYNLCKGAGALRSLDLVLGQWNVLTDGPSGSGDPSADKSVWFESDLYASLRAGLGERWTASGTYFMYYSPNSGFETIEEVQAGLAFDDAGLFGEGFSGLQPSVLVAFELHGQVDASTHLGTYAQVSIGPSFGLGKAGGLDISLSLPAIAGFSLSNYYQDATTGEDSTFGYLDVGCVLGAPVTFLPSRLGPWEAKLGLHGLWLGGSNARRNGDDDFEWIGTFGLGTTF